MAARLSDSGNSRGMIVSVPKAEADRGMKIVRIGEEADLVIGHGEVPMAKIKTKLDASAKDAHALHLQDEDDAHAAVAIWNLSVLIVPDEEHWFAQGLEINYGAQGDTEKEAQENFQRGLLATIHLHLKVHGSIERILTFAPSQILREAADNKDRIAQFDQVSFHEILDATAQKSIPFDGISYRVLKAAA